MKSHLWFVQIPPILPFCHALSVFISTLKYYLTPFLLAFLFQVPAHFRLICLMAKSTFNSVWKRHAFKLLGFLPALKTNDIVSYLTWTFVSNRPHGSKLHIKNQYKYVILSAPINQLPALGAHFNRIFFKEVPNQKHLTSRTILWPV